MVKRKKEKTRAKTRVHHFYTRRLTYLSFAWFQSWRPFWSYPLPVKSSAVADPLLYLLPVMCLCVCLVCKKCRRLNKKRLIFCFFPLEPRLSVFLSSCKAKKRQKISVETRNMLPLPTTTTTTHHHHYHHHHRDHHHLGEEGQHQQSTLDSEEMAFMASQLLDGNT